MAGFPGYMNNMPINLDGGALRAAVKSQLQYYFSANNLFKDLYLRRHMDSNGFVPIMVLAEFNRLRALTQNYGLILDVLRSDPGFFELSPCMMKVRPRENPGFWVHMNRLSSFEPAGEPFYHGSFSQAYSAPTTGIMTYASAVPLQGFVPNFVNQFGQPALQYGFETYGTELHLLHQYNPGPAVPTSQNFGQPVERMNGFTLNPNVPEFVPRRNIVGNGFSPKPTQNANVDLGDTGGALHAPNPSPLGAHTGNGDNNAMLGVPLVMPKNTLLGSPHGR